MATAMMYLRLLALAFIFNTEIFFALIPYFIPLILVSIFVGLYFNYKDKTIIKHQFSPNKNPLEFKTAFVFGLLFIVFAKITEVVMQYYGNSGIHVLSLVVGVTDIDPFILNLFQTKSAIIGIPLIVSSTVIATASNALIKMVYTLILGSKKIRLNIIFGFTAIIGVSIILLLSL
jgi:uncharacterized membrane protein (DUF4010 family)